MTIRIDDIIAALLLSLVMFRRLEVLSTRQEDNTHVPSGAFEAWRATALRAIHIAAIACLAKVFLSLAWFAMAPPPLWLVIGGASIFLGWVGALVWAWSIGTDARILKQQLGIRRGPPEADKKADKKG